MTNVERSVFFYGLFMDESLLAAKGVRTSAVSAAHVDGYRLAIGERATVICDESSRVYGVLATLSIADLERLYSEPSVADYVAEELRVTVKGDHEVSATSYVLPADQLAGASPEYAAALLSLAVRLGFPQDYLDQIRQFC